VLDMLILVLPPSLESLKLERLLLVLLALARRLLERGVHALDVRILHALAG